MSQVVPYLSVGLHCCWREGKIECTPPGGGHLSSIVRFLFEYVEEPGLTHGKYLLFQSEFEIIKQMKVFCVCVCVCV